MSRYKVYQRPSVADCLSSATTEAEVHEILLRAHRDLTPSAATKRKWMQRATTRLSQLRTRAISPVDRTPGGIILL